MQTHPSPPPSSARSRFLRAFPSLIAALGLVAGISAVPASAATPSTYFGLGDSVAAGTGGTDYTGPAGCLRTLQAYSTQLNGTNAACFGASTSDVPAQVGTAVNPSLRRVTITVGANDVGAGNVAQVCLGPDAGACQSAIAASTADLQTLPGKLAPMIAAVRAKAPNAVITLTGYPLLFTVAGLPASQRLVAAQINAATAQLNLTIASTALQSGALYADVTWRFLGHGIGSADSWIHRPDEPGLTPGAAFHPTSKGYTYGYVPAVRPFVG
ncbi:SGNH/GDSL hydrolase family protein [Sinomonas sp. R1AF57]|uniref:SGNH/GDSL hydrolase family protein n=1 Tax=Sinomonas sp. R1AF57 TaxID=2020377 RepID=UPI001ABF642E|nr:SGNH/GDSL hydrolase family protein [Sinomonas sp. R1AF57]